MFETYMIPASKLYVFHTKTIVLPIPFAHDGLRRSSVHDGFGDNWCTTQRRCRRRHRGRGRRRRNANANANANAKAMPHNVSPLPGMSQPRFFPAFWLSSNVVSVPISVTRHATPRRNAMPRHATPRHATATPMPTPTPTPTPTPPRTIFLSIPLDFTRFF